MADGARTFTDQDSGDLILDDGVAGFETADVGPHFENLITSVVPSSVVDDLSSMLTEQISWDQDGRTEWETNLAKNVELLGLGPESAADSDDAYENADTSDSPLMLTALLRFQSKALSAMLPMPDRVCRTESAIDLDAVEDPKEAEQLREDIDSAGRRVEKFVADYLLNGNQSYRSETDRLLYECGMHGVGVRKVYNDLSREAMPTRVKQVDINRIILSYDTKSFTCGRITEVIDMPTPDLIRNLRNGTFTARDISIEDGGESEGPLTEAEDRIFGYTSGTMREGDSHRIYEVRMELFLEGDPHPKGLARPYIITIHAASQTILSLRRNWQQGDLDESPIECYVAYLFHSGKNAVSAMGLGHILSNVTRSLRKAQRRGLEAAYLQNHPSGYKLSNMKIREGSSKVVQGEFVDVDTPTNDIRSAIMLHPFQGPSQGLLALADKMEQNGRELGGIAAIDFSSLMKSGVAAGPAMAAYDESNEFQTAIHSRLYHGHATEMRLIMDRLREVYAGRPVPYGVNSVLLPEDLTMVNLLPIMRPSQISRQRQILEAHTIYEMSTAAPDIIDRRKAIEDYVRAMGKPDVSEYILPDPSEEKPEPSDPLTEYTMVLNGTPIRAGISQNHQAHIDSHASQMRMLQTSSLAVEQGMAAQAALSAHIAEHMGLQMSVDVAARIGMPLDQMVQIPPEMEGQIAEQIAQGIAAIEQERTPAEQAQESRSQVEQIKGQNQQSLEQIKHRQAMELEKLKAAHAAQLQQQRDDAAMERAEQDDDSALAIAQLPNRNSAPTRSGGLS